MPEDDHERPDDPSAVNVEDRDDAETVNRDADSQTRHERAETDQADAVVAAATPPFEDLSYPIAAEDLARTYADHELELPIDEESLGDVFDRVGDRTFESAGAVRAAVHEELGGDASVPADDAG